MCSTSGSYLMRTKCAVVGCISTGLTHRLFRFPRQNERYREWADFSQNPKLKNVLNKRAYMCLKHFSTNQFRADEPKKLIYNATPTYLILDDKVIAENESSSSDDGNNSEQEDEDTSSDPQIDQKSENSDVEYVTQELIPIMIVPSKDNDDVDDDVVIVEDADVTIIKSLQKQKTSPLNNIAKYRELRRIRKSLKRLTKKRMTPLNIWPKETMESFIQIAYDVGFQQNVQPELRNIDLQNQKWCNKLTPLSEQTLPTIVKDEDQQMLARPLTSYVTPLTNYMMSSISSETTQYQIKRRSSSQVSRSIVNPINYSDNHLVNVQNNSLIYSQSNPLPVQPTTSTVTNSLDQINIQKQMSEIHEQPSTKILSDPQQVQLKLNVQPLQVLIEKAFCSSQVTETHTHSELPPTIKLKTSTKLNGSPKSGNFLTTIASILTSSQTNSEKENSILIDVGTENKDQRKTNIQQTQNHTLKTVNSTMTTSQNDLKQENSTIMNEQFETFHKQQETEFSPTDSIDQTKICRFFEQQSFNEQQSLNKMSPVTYMKSDLSFVKSTVSSRDKNIQPSNNDQQLVIGNTETIIPSKSSSQETPVDIYCSVSKDKSHFSSVEVNKMTVPLIKTNSPYTQSIFVSTMDTVIQSMSSQKNSVASFSHTTKPCLQSTVVDVQSPTKPYQSTNVDPKIVNNEYLTKPYQQSTNIDPTIVNNEYLTKPRHQSTCVNPTVVEIHHSTRSHHKSTYVDRTVVNNEYLTKPYQQSTNIDPTVVNNEYLTKPRHQSTCVNPTVVEIHHSTRSHHKSTYVDRTVVNNEYLTKPYQQSTNIDTTVVNNEYLTKPRHHSTCVNPTVVEIHHLTRSHHKSTFVDRTVVNNESLTKPYQQSTNVDPTDVNNEYLTKPCHQSTCVVNPTVVEIHHSTRSHHKSTYVDRTVVDSESPTKPCHQSTLVNPTILDGKSVNSMEQFKKNIVKKQLFPIIKDCFVDLSRFNNDINKTYKHDYQSPVIQIVSANQNITHHNKSQATFTHPFALESHNVNSQDQHLTDINPTALDDKPAKLCKNLQSEISPTVVNYQNELSTCVSLQALATQNECSQNQQCTDLQPDLSIPSIVARKHALYANKKLLMDLKPLNSEKKLSATVPTSEGTLMIPQIKPITQSKFQNLTICNCKKASSSEKLTKDDVLEEPPSERLHKRSGILLKTHNGSSVNKKQVVDNLESKDEDNIHSPLYKPRGMACRTILKKRKITNVSKQRKRNVIRKICKDSDPLRISSQATTSYIESQHIKPTVSKVRMPKQHFSQDEVLNKPLRKRIDPSFTLDVRQHFNTIKLKNNKSKAKKSSQTEFEHCLKSKLLLPFSINSKATNDILDKSFNPKDFEVQFQSSNCTPSFEQSLTSEVVNLTDNNSDVYNYSPKLKSSKSLLPGFPLKFTETSYTNKELLLYKTNLIKTYANNRRKQKTNCEGDTSKSRVFKQSKLDLEDKLSNHEHDANDTTVSKKCNQLTKTIEILDDFDDNKNPSKQIQIITSEDNSDNSETEQSQLLSTNKLVKSISETPFSKIPVVPTVVQQILNSDTEGKSVINYYTNLQPMVTFDQSVTSFEQAVSKYLQSKENSVSNHTGISRPQNHPVYINYGEQNLRMMGISSKELMEQDPVKPLVIQLESAWST